MPTKKRKTKIIPTKKRKGEEIISGKCKATKLIVHSKEDDYQIQAV
jgi:hypothetical protein